MIAEEVGLEEGELEELEITSETSTESKKMSPLRAIKLRCIDCCGGSYSEVKVCPSVNCALYPFRTGRNPFREKRVMTDEQRQQLAERLARARAEKA